MTLHERKHQHGAQLNDSNQSNNFIFDEHNICHQVGNGHFDFDITLEKIGGNFNNFDGDGNISEPTRLMINAFANSKFLNNRKWRNRTEHIRWRCFDKNEVFNK